MNVPIEKPRRGVIRPRHDTEGNASMQGKPTATQPPRNAVFRCGCGRTTTRGLDYGFCPSCGSRFQWIGQEWRVISGTWVTFYAQAEALPIS